MNIKGKSYRTLWVAEDGVSIEIIDQTYLPHKLVTAKLSNTEQTANAISNMQVRGAPLIGITAAFGLCLQINQDPSDASIEKGVELLKNTRPTAINLKWALEQIVQKVNKLPLGERSIAAFKHAQALCEEDVQLSHDIGKHGSSIIEKLSAIKSDSKPVNILTHCNAGWLATIDWGTALAPIYVAQEKGVPLHVWVDETRPRNQGAALTAFELNSHGVPHTVIADNTGGHLMQNRLVDLCIVGSDRTTAQGDVCNKIGTYLKALAAFDNDIPFYVALPYSTIDWSIKDGIKEIPIETRSATEVTNISGLTKQGDIVSVQVTPQDSPVANYAFDVTPARFVTGLITERGICEASAKGLNNLYGK